MSKPLVQNMTVEEALAELEYVAESLMDPEARKCASNPSHGAGWLKYWGEKVWNARRTLTIALKELDKKESP